MGFAEIVLLLLSLTGFGAQENPNAPSAQEVMKYAPAEADVMLYLDAEAVLPGNWKFLTSLRDDRVVKGVPDLHRAVGTAIAAAEGFRQIAAAQYGFDPVTDVKSVAAWIAVKPEDSPLLVVVRGKFPPDLVERVAKDLDAPLETVNGRALMKMPDDDDNALSTTDDGSLVFGAVGLVRERTAKAWKPKKAKKATLAAHVGPTIDAKPFFFLASSPTPATVKLIEKELRGEEELAVVLDLLTGHEFGSASLYWNGLGWTFRARTAAGYERAIGASEGAIALIRAAHLMTRGLAQLALAAVDSYAGADPIVAEIMKHKAELMRLVEQWSGDGMFAAAVDKKKGERTVTVTATGAKLTDVLPLGGLAIPGAALWLFVSSSGQYEPPEEYTPPARPTKPPARKKQPR